MFSSLTGSAPASDDRMIRPSLVKQYREGRSPFQSKVAPTISPLVKHKDAGPSQGSISDE